MENYREQNLLKKHFMTRFLFIGIIGLLVAACGQNTQTMSNDLTQLENDWMRATMKKNKAVLEQLVAPEFTVTGMKYLDSAAVTRSMWMQNTMQDLKIDSVHFLNMKVTTTSEVGIVRAEFFWSGAYAQSKFADTTFFVDTWVKRGGDWRVVSRIVTD
ncbi:MAG TPA: nuclear transport factor 2 family protein [Flavisolibacter sp.]|nr:nuclear transport factor 2 family protein [Flavisolibacter sp.]